MAMTQTSAEPVRSKAKPSRFPVNIRLTIPFPSRPFFIALIVGPERRGPERRRVERARHPINTWGNLATVAATWTIFTVAALFAVLVIATI